jgi:hypothetical protein
MLDGVAEAVEAPDAWIPSPPESEPAKAPHADQLVGDQVRDHAHERELAPPLADQLMPGCERDEVAEALERDLVAVDDELGDGLGERHDTGHRIDAPEGGIRSHAQWAATSLTAACALGSYCAL